MRVLVAISLDAVATELCEERLVNCGGRRG